MLPPLFFSRLPITHPVSPHPPSESLHICPLPLSASLQFCFNSLPFIGVAVPQTASPQRRERKKKQWIPFEFICLCLTASDWATLSPPLPPHPSCAPFTLSIHLSLPSFLLRNLPCFFQQRMNNIKRTLAVSATAQRSSQVPNYRQIISVYVSAAISLSLLIVMIFHQTEAYCVPD